MPPKKYEYMEIVFRFDEIAKENEKRKKTLFVYKWIQMSSSGTRLERE